MPHLPLKSRSNSHFTWHGAQVCPCTVFYFYSIHSPPLPTFLSVSLEQPHWQPTWHGPSQTQGRRATYIIPEESCLHSTVTFAEGQGLCQTAPHPTAESSPASGRAWGTDYDCIHSFHQFQLTCFQMIFNVHLLSVRYWVRPWGF